MDRQKLIDGVVANGAFDEADRRWLDSLTDDRLRKVVANAGPPVPPPPAENKCGQGQIYDEEMGKCVPDTTVPAPTGNQRSILNNGSGSRSDCGCGGHVTANGTPKLSLKEFLAGAPAEVAEQLEEGIAIANRRREALVTAIVGNAKNRFTKEYLEARKTQELEGIAALIEEPVSPLAQGHGRVLAANYLGAAGAPAYGNAIDEEPLPLPSMAPSAK